MNYVAISKTTQIENQDRVSIVENDEDILIILSDGAGGTSGGTEAAEFTVNNLLISNAQNPVDTLRDLDESIFTNPKTGEATVVYLRISEGKISGASIGDSEAWLIQGEKIVDITENQHRKPLLGTGRAIVKGFHDIPFVGTLIVASDGLTKYVPISKIISTITDNNNLDVCCIKLIELVRYKSGILSDDTTVILCKL